MNETFNKNKAVILAASIAISESSLQLPVVTVSALKDVLKDMEGKNMDLVLLPQYVLGDISKEEERQKLNILCSFAADNMCYVVYNYIECLEESRFCTSVIVDREGKEAGRYRKTHLIEGMDVQMSPGNELLVFELDFGRVALLAGTDIYFPEPAEVYSIKGAEILLCSMGMEPLRDDTQVQRLLRARAIEDYLYVAASTYASTKKMYMTNNYDLYNKDTEEAYITMDCEEMFNSNGLGLMTGRAVVYDLRGEVIASTGREAGQIVCEIDMGRKRNIKDYIFGTGAIVYHQNKRGVFSEILKEACYSRKTNSVSEPVISLVHMKYEDTIGVVAAGELEEQGINYKKLFDYIERAAVYSDMVVCSELSAPGNKLDEETKNKYSECAARNNSYILINQEIDGINTSLIFDRSGQVIFKYEKVNTLNMMYENKLPAGSELPVVELDFGTVGVMVCADAYCQEIPRILSLKGVEIIILQTQSWGYDANAINEGVIRSWAVENCVYVVMSNFPSSQVVHRSRIIDPTGETVFASGYNMGGIYSTRLNLEAVTDKNGYVYKDGRVKQDSSFRKRLMKARRPDLYSLLAGGREDME